MMKNFDYLQDIEALKDLYGFCSAAEDTQQTNYDVCALNGRRALEWIVKAIYTLKGIELDKRTSLLEMMSSEPFTQFIGDDDKLMMASCLNLVLSQALHHSAKTLYQSHLH